MVHIATFPSVLYLKRIHPNIDIIQKGEIPGSTLELSLLACRTSTHHRTPQLFHWRQETGCLSWGLGCHQGRSWYDKWSLVRLNLLLREDQWADHTRLLSNRCRDQRSQTAATIADRLWSLSEAIRGSDTIRGSKYYLMVGNGWKRQCCLLCLLQSANWQVGGRR